MPKRPVKLLSSESSTEISKLEIIWPSPSNVPVNGSVLFPIGVNSKSDKSISSVNT